ncbi:MAG: flagellar protein FlaG [Kiloniellaceae bacterium]
MIVGATTASLPAPTETSRDRSQASAPSSAPTKGLPAVQAPVASFQSSSRSRLAYDRDLGRVFIEIVDRDSGEVIDRYPPEELVRHIDSRIEKNAARRRGADPGLLFSQII